MESADQGSWNMKYPDGETKKENGTTFITDKDGCEYEIRDRFDLYTGFNFESEDLE